MGTKEETRRDELLRLNKQQAQFYDVPASQRSFNVVTRLWLVLRRRMYFLMQNSGIWEDVFRLQKEWMGELKGKKVLDFGCYKGNVLTPYLATNAGSYLGVDLSRSGLAQLGEWLEKNGIGGARLQCVDVLSKDFTESGFDIIYAQGVLHHFNPIDVILPVLFEKLAPGGKIISLDPLQTSLLTRSVRAIYQPFRSDKEWECPFTKDTFAAIRKYFVISRIQGVIGFSKLAVPIVVLNKSAGVKAARYLHGKDMAFAGREGRSAWRCMQVAMCLEKRAGGMVCDPGPAGQC